MPDNLPKVYGLDLTERELNFICIALSIENAVIVDDMTQTIRSTVQLRHLVRELGNADAWVAFAEGLNLKIAKLRGWRLCEACGTFHEDLGDGHKR